MLLRYSVITSLALLMLLLGACGSPTPAPIPTNVAPSATPPQQVPTSEQPYPAPAAKVEAYPVPTSSPLQPEVITMIPSPSPDKGTVTGVLMVTTPDSAQPVANAVLALAEVVTDQDGKPLAAKLSQETTLRALTDIQGRFVFVDVPPGQYGLVFDKIAETFLLKNPNTGKDFLFQVEAGQVLDLGELVYEELPTGEQ